MKTLPVFGNLSHHHPHTVIHTGTTSLHTWFQNFIFTGYTSLESVSGNGEVSTSGLDWTVARRHTVHIANNKLNMLVQVKLYDMDMADYWQPVNRIQVEETRLHIAGLM